MNAKLDRSQFLRMAGGLTALAVAPSMAAEEDAKSSWPEQTLKSLRHPSLKNRVIIVTGGSRGFGWFIARELLAGGARVVLTGRGAEALAKVAGEVEHKYGKGRCLTVAGDVTHKDDCARTIDETLKAFGRIDVLINNAGRSPQDFGGRVDNSQAFYDTPDEALDTIIDTNLKGVFMMSKFAAPHLVKQKFGKIISVSTSAGNMIRGGNSIYGPAKAALEAMHRCWAQELKGTGVDANIVLPGGASDTSFISTAVVAGPVGERAAAGRLLPGDVIVPAAVWLCTDATNGLSGERVVAKNWDKTAARPEEAFKKCLDPHVPVPQIM